MATIFYECDKCGKCFDDEQSAESCENSHMDPSEIVFSVYQCGEAAPMCICVDYGYKVVNYWATDERTHSDRIYDRKIVFNNEYIKRNYPLPENKKEKILIGVNEIDYEKMKQQLNYLPNAINQVEKV